MAAERAVHPEPISNSRRERLMQRPKKVRAVARRAMSVGAAVVVLAAIVPSAPAALIVPGLYQLHNHPDGEAGPPGYGLRLDELIDVSGAHDVFTFDFDHELAAMFLDYDGSSIHIFGTAFGGLDIGNGYDPAYSGLLTFDFTFGAVAGVPGDDDLHVVTPNFTNSGLAAMAGANAVQRALYDYAGDFGFTFRFGDEDDDLGHRGFAGISGWGWMTYSPDGPHVEGVDWLFTATLVPSPSALALFAIAARGRRRRRA